MVLLPLSLEIFVGVIDMYLDENKQLIMAILEHQSVGKAAECSHLQTKLQENLMYLAKIADAQPQGTPQPQHSQGMPPQTQEMSQPLQAQQWGSIQLEKQQQHYMMQPSQGQGEWQQQPSMTYLGPAPKHPFQMNDPKQQWSHQG
ncbi:GRF1-interacting factor 3 [Linum grandiflorum]